MKRNLDHGDRGGHVKRALKFFWESDKIVFRNAVARLPASHRTFFEEVYYASLVHELLQNSTVALLHAWMSEYRGGQRSGDDHAPFLLGKSLFPAHVYHNLKKPERFRAVAENAHTLLRDVHRVAVAHRYDFQA